MAPRKFHTTAFWRKVELWVVKGHLTQQRPRILEHPADAVAAREEPLTLNCKAAGRPTPEITWFHNGTPLVPSERRVVLPEGSLFFLR
uniref:Ig-like domain-containing protein n=1 Tax=Lutzomyia longipalpis TaxID=7200 RepID=A0A1B0CQS5_LUTLO